MVQYVVTLRKVCILMNVNTISYWFVEAISSIIKNQKIFLSGVAVMIVALFLISLFYVAFGLSGSLMEIMEESQGKIEVFLKDIDEAQTENVKNSILMINGVEGIDYISKAEAYERAKSRVPEAITKDVPSDLYPASFIVSISDLEAAKNIALTIRGIDGVGEEESDVMVNENSEFIGKVAITVRIVAITIFIITAVSACFIMMNSIKLMLYSRRREISIMKYVGATDLFTKAPFVIEGLIIALVSAIIVIILTSFICNGLANVSATVPMFAFLDSAKDIMSSLSLILIILSAMIGTIGSSASINKYLDV